MCGIIAEFNKKNKKANDFIINQFEEQHARGQRGFGIIRINKKGETKIDRACETTKFLLDLYLKPSPMIIAHHRTPTSTPNWLDQTHPIIVSNKILKNDYYIIHNGIISNDTELHKKHKELGFKYTTEYQEEYYNEIKSKWNDSESLAIELALFIENKITAIGIDNGAAFIVLQINKKTKKAKKVFFGKNRGSSDLNINKTKEYLRISSEGEGEKVEENILFSFLLNDIKMKLSKKEIRFERKEKETTWTTNLTLPPINTPITTKTAQENKETILSEEKDKFIPSELRIWYDEDDESTQKYISEPMIYKDKNYKETTNEEFRLKLKGEDTNSITHILDDSLDEEIEKITELATYFKDNLIMNKPHEKEIGLYLSQIANILKTMEKITDTAEEDYEEKMILEKEEEEQDIADYNAGFFPPKGEEERKFGFSRFNF